MRRVIEIINKSNKKVIFFCHSMLHIMQSYIIISATQRDRADFGMVLTTVDSSDVSRHQMLCQKINASGIKCYFIDKKSVFHRAVGISDYRNNCLKKKIYQDFRIENNDYYMVNFCWNQQYVCYPSSYFFKDVNECIFLEEGASQFVNPLKNRVSLWAHELYGNQCNFWKLNKIKGIYVRKPEKYRTYLQPYLIKICDSNSLYNDALINELLCIFLDGRRPKLIDKYKSSDVGIVFTQPLSEDGYMTEREKVQLYKKIIDRYSKLGEPVIKTHPRDTTDYGSICEYVDYEKYPSELLSLFNTNYKYAIGVSTSAIYGISAEIQLNIDESALCKNKKGFLTSIKPRQ